MWRAFNNMNSLSQGSYSECNYIINVRVLLAVRIYLPHEVLSPDHVPFTYITISNYIYLPSAKQCFGECTRRKDKRNLVCIYTVNNSVADENLL